MRRPSLKRTRTSESPSIFLTVPTMPAQNTRRLTTRRQDQSATVSRGRMLSAGCAAPQYFRMWSPKPPWPDCSARTLIGVGVKVIFMRPCIFYMENHE